MRRAFLVACALLAVTMHPAAQARRAAALTWTPITVRAAAVPLNPLVRSQSTLGPFTYAGGLALTSTQTRRLHGLSDLHVDGSGRLTAVGDEGVLVTARLVLDRRNQLVNIRDARLATLVGVNGKTLSLKEEADAEGLAVFPNGDRVVSFERQHRILLYPASGGTPRLLPKPDIVFSQPNGGMEAVAPDPARGADAYIVAVEATGETFTCRMATGCMKAGTLDVPVGTSVVAIRRMPGNRTAYLFRGGGANTLPRVVLRIVGNTSTDAELTLFPPLTVDNFEGVAVVPRSNGGFRFYLLSDDNVSARQRTLLLAFDWLAR